MACSGDWKKVSETRTLKMEKSLAKIKLERLRDETTNLMGLFKGFVLYLKFHHKTGSRMFRFTHLKDHSDTTKCGLEGQID